MIEVLLIVVLVKRMIVDSGYANNIIYSGTLAALPPRNGGLRPGGWSLFGIDGRETCSVGIVELCVGLEKYLAGKTLASDFLVINERSTYNGVIDIPLLNDFHAIVLTVHIGTKFPTLVGVAKISGDIALARACCSSFEKTKWTVVPIDIENLDPEEKKKDSTKEEIENFVLHPEKPKQVIRLGLVNKGS